MNNVTTERPVKAAGITKGKVITSVCYLILSLVLGFSYVSSDASFDYNSQQLADFTQARPYQLRILFPLIAHILNHSVYRSARLWFDLFVLIAVVALPFCFANFLSEWFPEQESRILTFLIYPPVALDYVVTGGGFEVYDIPSMVFFIVGLTMIIRTVRGMPTDQAAYLGLLTIAILNRETAILLIISYALLLFRQPYYRTYASMLTAQCLIYVVCRCILMYVFRNSPGSTFLNELSGNWQIVKSSLSFSGVTAFLASATCAYYWISIPFNWSIKPREVKLLYLVGALDFAILFAVGIISEVRIYSEIVVILTLGLAFSVQPFLRQAMSELAKT